MTVPGPLGIVAGEGELPVALARAVQESGRPVFVVGLEGIADPAALAQFPHAFTSLGEIGKAMTLLKRAGCSEVTLAGRVARPQFSKLRLDAVAARHIRKIASAALGGDDSLLRAVIAILEEQGLTVIGSADATRTLLAPTGPIGKFTPMPANMADIRQGFRVATVLGELDIGQAAVVCDGLVLAVEAAEGTDAMLDRVAGLPTALRGSDSARRGVLVKTVKPKQDRRVDLPVIGAATVERAAAAGLSGIAVGSGTVLVVDRQRVADISDRCGMFVVGFDPGTTNG